MTPKGVKVVGRVILIIVGVPLVLNLGMNCMAFTLVHIDGDLKLVGVFTEPVLVKNEQFEIYRDNQYLNRKKRCTISKNEDILTLEKMCRVKFIRIPCR